MKTNRRDIIHELHDLDADFLLKDKERSFLDMENDSLSDDFYTSVMSQVDTKPTPVISITQQKESWTNIWKIAASFVVLLSVVGLIYAILPKMSPAENSLQDLLADTSSQEILDYLYETGVPADEEFILEYVGETIVFND